MKNTIIIFLLLCSIKGFSQVPITRTLSNVNNTADSLKPVSKAQASINTSLQSSINTNTSNIATNASNVSTNTSNITTNSTAISTNTSNIATNTANIATNTANILMNATAITTKLNKTGDVITGDLDNTTTGFFRIASGTTAQRPISPMNGMLRYNTDVLRNEFYSNGAWRAHARLEGDTFTGNIFAPNLSGTNTGDQDLSGYTPLSSYNTLTSTVSTNTTNIATNTANISTNTGNITANSTAISTNTSNIATNTSNIATNTGSIANKVDKVLGKGLSTNDYTTIEKVLISTVPSDALFVRKNYAIAQLVKWKIKGLTSPSTAKILFVGDSTSDLLGPASALPVFMNNYTSLGQSLANFNVSSNMPNFGSSGNTIQNFYNNLTQMWGINQIIAQNPDLIVFSYGINDIRQNQLTKDQLKTYIINCINTLRTSLPNCDFVLRMPNSFLSVSPTGFIQQGSYSSIAQAAQAQTDILYYAYKELENYWDNVILLNTQDEIYGRTCNVTSSFMQDELHPNYSSYQYLIDRLIEKINYNIPYSKLKSIDAMNRSYNTPYTIYPRALENTSYFTKKVSGTLSAQASNYFSISCNNSADAQSKIMPGDIVNFGDAIFFKLNSLSFYQQNSGSLLISIPVGTIPANSLPLGTTVTIYRSIYNNSVDAEKYVNDRVNYPYFRKAIISYGGTNFFDVTNYSDDELMKYTQFLSPSRYQIQAGDVLIPDGMPAYTLSAGTVVTNQYSQARIFGNTGDFSTWSGKVVYIFGNHDYEQSKSSLVVGTDNSNYGSRSAILEVIGTNKGSIPAPKMTTIQRNSISGPTAGLMVYDTDLLRVMSFDGTIWGTVGSLTGSFTATASTQTAFTVTLPTTMPNATYKIGVTPSSILATGGYVSSKTTTNFVYTCPSATGTVSFDWEVFR